MDRFGGWREVLAGLTDDPSPPDDGLAGPPHHRRWVLGPLSGVDPALLLRDEKDSLGRLFLTLAVAFNDLKGLVVFEGYLLDYGIPIADRVTPQVGQWRGLQTHLQRCIAGVLFELMIVLTDKRSREPLASSELRQVLNTVPLETRTRWNSLISDAPVHSPMSNVRASLLYQLRNCAAFHYDQVSLARSFLEIFGEQPARVELRQALFSYGPDMDGTRYYYADAAAQKLFTGLAEGRSETSTDRAVIEIAIQVNEALAPMIHAFIVHRGATTT